MSTNTNRSKLKVTLTSKEYRIKQMKFEYDYCLICSKRNGCFYTNCSPMNMRSRARHGNGKIVSTFDKRAYRTWKHTRKTQWK
jgi:hypothetical protein